MNIALVVSRGGHLAEINAIISKKTLEEHNVIYFTEESSHTKKMKNTHVLKPWKSSYNPFEYVLPFFRFMKLLRKEKVDLVISTGAEIALPAFFAAKFLGIKTVFIETITRLRTPTLTGKICYPFSNVFLTQNPNMEKYYGKRTSMWEELYDFCNGRYAYSRI